MKKTFLDTEKAYSKEYACLESMLEQVAAAEKRVELAHRRWRRRARLCQMSARSRRISGKLFDACGPAGIWHNRLV